MLPPDVGIHQRQRWSLEELIAHWARQGASQSDMLYLAWKLLNRANRPEGLKIEMGLHPGDNTARGSADIPNNGAGELSSLKNTGENGC